MVLPFELDTAKAEFSPDGKPFANAGFARLHVAGADSSAYIAVSGSEKGTVEWLR
jgi:hypothetical protein